MTITKKPKKTAQKSANHRSRVGIVRREKTRLKLLQAALVVFSSHGIDASVIDLIIKEAGVSRGTFYNYFRTNEDLYFATAAEVSNEMIRIVDPLVLRQTDPAARMACGIIAVVKVAELNPLLAKFILRGGPAAVISGNLVTETLSRDLSEGMAIDRFTVPDMKLAFDLIIGAALMAFNAILTTGISKTYPQELAQAVLQALGVSKSTAKKCAFRDFGEIAQSESALLNLPMHNAS